jgi:Leucine-rich repeat (LRR) protein
MKNLLLVLLVLPIIGFAQIVNIPDANFKDYLVANKKINTNDDKEIQISEANAFSGEIVCRQRYISNLKGIEAFTALTELNCTENHLRSLDVSKNTALTSLWCNSNKLTSLDVSKNTALISLVCGANQLTSLDVSNNTALDVLLCFGNRLSSLDISKNTALITLVCGDNQLTSLDVSNNTALTSLICEGNIFDCYALKRKYGLLD